MPPYRTATARACCCKTCRVAVRSYARYGAQHDGQAKLEALLHPVHQLAVVLRPKETKKFVLLPRRWVVERTFAWLNLSRRLSKSYERLPKTDEAWIYIAMTRIMLNRLA
ncbi:transposase [Candidatus Methylobacter oryzae]|uniref:Transposase n=1 Tax=Candidatus Methylobacter oryzae TaxID=2497749 RepID=A0ABY3CEV1_9GAMM|nr:transposase [Candidatus Methylobacter oryzae]